MWLFFLGGGGLLLSCADEPDDDPGATRLANTVPGHADVQVTGSYRGDDIEDYWGAAVEALETGRFLVSWIDGSSPYTLRFRRYDMGSGGWLSPASTLDTNVRNVRRAGQVTATEGGVTQSMGWLVWDYHPSATWWTVNWARIRADGTGQVKLDAATDAAAPAGAAGSVGYPPQPRVLITYPSGSIWDDSGHFLACGAYLRAVIYDAVGNVVVGPFVVDGPVAGHCCHVPLCTDMMNPKFFDDIGGANDQDPIGSRACTNPSYNRGYCYRGEAMATAGPYTLALYGEWLVAPPRPLFLTILDAS